MAGGLGIADMRLFVAIELSADVRSMLVRMQRSLRKFDGAVRWLRDDQLHLTLKFLGQIRDAAVPAVVDALDRSVSEGVGLHLRTQGAGCFPPEGRVRVVWVGLADEGGTLRRCRSRIERSLAEMGIPRETRPFSPHLTVGRVKDDRTCGRLRDSVAAVTVPVMDQTVDAIVLMQSTLAPAGATYSQVARFEMSQIRRELGDGSQ